MSDTNNVQKAMDWLAETPDGASALKAVSDAGEALRAQLPVRLSNAELRYVMERLWAQRSTEGWDQHARYNVQPTVAGATGIAEVKLPANLANVRRVRDYGFAIKASIPKSDFEELSRNR